MGNAIRWTQEQLDEFEQRRHPGRRATDPPAAPKASKYRNQKTTVDGVTYDSAKEARRSAQLAMMQDAGMIADLKRQVSFELAPGVMLAGDRRRKPPLRYVADFTYVRAGELVIEDVKSEHSRTLGEYRIKRHLMKSVLNLDITEV